jgi:polysaccharide chain length determinant protein (PEP-CTERM system associated)
MHELADQLLSKLKATWRYRWYAIAAAWVIALGGWTVVHQIPNRYEAHARVYVDTQSMLRPLLSGLTVQLNVEQMIAMMSRTLVSRVNVEKVIEMAGLDAGLKSAEDREHLIVRLTRDISVKSAGRENLYTISYASNGREQTKLVVDSLLAIFMQGSVGDKRKESDTARQFIEDQLRNYADKLAAAEQAVSEFKRRNQGLLPGEGRDYYARLSDARNALRQASLELREAVNSRDAIKQQLADESPSSSRAGDRDASARPISDLDARIQGLEQKLDNLRLNYTDAHPDVVATVRTIAQLKEQKAAEARSERPAARAPQGPAYQQLLVSLAAAEANVAAMKARVEEYTARYNELQAAASASPQVEAEFKQLTRDYEVIKSRYDRLLERRESAQISSDVEASDAALGFRVIDPPQMPMAPTSPNRPRLMSLVLLAALGAGLGFAFLMSQVKTTFSDERNLKDATGIPVLGTVALVWNDEQKRRSRRGFVALMLSIFSLLSAYAAIMASLVLATARI